MSHTILRPFRGLCCPVNLCRGYKHYRHFITMSKDTFEEDKKANSWDAFASCWDSEPSVTEFDLQAHTILSDVTANLVENKAACFLDFGCATGRMVMHMAPLYQKIAAVDLSQKMIAAVNDKLRQDATLAARIHTYAGDLLSDPVDDIPDVFNGPFDMIYTGSVLTFCPDPRAVLNNLYARLRKNGVMVHAVWKVSEEASTKDFTKGYSRSELCEELEAVGLKNVHIYKNDITVDDSVWIVGIGIKA